MNNITSTAVKLINPSGWRPDKSSCQEVIVLDVADGCSYEPSQPRQSPSALVNHLPKMQKVTYCLFAVPISANETDHIIIKISMDRPRLWMTQSVCQTHGYVSTHIIWTKLYLYLKLTTYNDVRVAASLLLVFESIHWQGVKTFDKVSAVKPSSRP